MKIAMNVTLATDRVSVHLADGTVLFDDAGLIFLEPGHKGGKPVLTGIGTNLRPTGPETKVLPVVSTDPFDPARVAIVTDMLVKWGWVALRPGWKQIFAPLDHLDVSISIEGYEALTADSRRAFVKTLPYNPQITWWVAGERVKF